MTRASHVSVVRARPTNVACWASDGGGRGFGMRRLDRSALVLAVVTMGAVAFGGCSLLAGDGPTPKVVDAAAGEGGSPEGSTGDDDAADTGGGPTTGSVRLAYFPSGQATQAIDVCIAPEVVDGGTPAYTGPLYSSKFGDAGARGIGADQVSAYRSIA